jgi:hypothetical protein
MVPPWTPARPDGGPRSSSLIPAGTRPQRSLRTTVENPAGAERAARRGLVAAPYDERLYPLLLAADPAGVEAVMDELLRRLDEEGLEPDDALHKKTRELLPAPAADPTVVLASGPGRWPQPPGP